MADRDSRSAPTGRRAGGGVAAAPPSAGERTGAILATVQEAVGAGRARLAFQPVVAARAPHRPVFYEGLIRVLDRSGRVIPACDFITEVEDTPLGRRIDALALRQGFAALKERPQLRLSINLSARTIGDSMWMAELDRGIAADPTAAERLILELTESSPVAMPVRVGAFIAELQRRNIAFAVDDFGAGYTSMRHLRDFRFDILKIDGAISGDMATNLDHRALVMAVVSISRHFEMMCVAERVETAADAIALAEIGIDCLQGYHFAAPTLRPDWQDCALDRSA